MNTLKWVVLSVCLAAAAMTAQANDVLNGTIEAFVVRADADGNETLGDASVAKPGDVLEYVLTYRSSAENPLEDVVITAPVPGGVEFVAGSATTEAKATFEATIDDGQSWQAEPVKRIVQTDAGLREETVNPTEYSSVRWKNVTALEPGETREFRYRVRVAGDNS